VRDGHDNEDKHAGGRNDEDEGAGGRDDEDEHATGTTMKMSALAGRRVLAGAMMKMSA